MGVPTLSDVGGGIWDWLHPEAREYAESKPTKAEVDYYRTMPDDSRNPIAAWQKSRQKDLTGPSPSGSPSPSPSGPQSYGDTHAVGNALATGASLGETPGEGLPAELLQLLIGGPTNFLAGMAGGPKRSFPRI